MQKRCNGRASGRISDFLCAVAITNSAQRIPLWARTGIELLILYCNRWIGVVVRFCRFCTTGSAPRDRSQDQPARSVQELLERTRGAYPFSIGFLWSASNKWNVSFDHISCGLPQTKKLWISITITTVCLRQMKCCFDLLLYSIFLQCLPSLFVIREVTHSRQADFIQPW